MEISVSTMDKFSGSEENCAEYAKAFCQYVVMQAERGAGLLSALANLESYSGNLEAEADSAMVRIKSAFDTLQNFESKFRRYTYIEVIFSDAKAKVNKLEMGTIDHYRTLKRWLEQARKIG